MHRLGDYRGHISIAYQETRPGAVNTLGGGPWPFSAGRPAMAEPGRGGTMGRPSPELGPAVEAGAVRACRVADRRRSIPDRRRPEPPADKQRQHQRQRAKQTRPPMRKAGSRPPAPPARQRPGTTSQRRQHQQSASQANTPTREDTKRARLLLTAIDSNTPPPIPSPGPAAGPPGADEDLCGFESAKID